MSDTEVLLKSNSEPVRRLVVLTGAGRRRAWTAEQKAQIVAETYASDEAVSAVARRHGLTPQQLFAWRWHARQGGPERSGDRSIAFAPVIVDGAQPGAAIPTASRLAVIEIVVGAATVRVSPGIDAATLQMVLRAVRTAT